MADRRTDDVHVACLARALEARGLAFDRLWARFRPGQRDGLWLRFAAAGRIWFYRGGRLLVGSGAELVAAEHVNGRALQITRRKHGTKVALHRAGIAVPAGAVLGPGQRDSAVALFERLGARVCLKPDRGSKGIDVVTDVSDRADFLAAFADLATRHQGIVVERHVPGEVFRVMCVDGRCFAVRLSRPASVLGDGRLTVSQLVATKNAERERRAVPGHVPLVLDERARAMLARQAVSERSVPAAGQRVWLRGTSNTASGGDVVGWPADLHADHVAFAERAAAAIPGVRLSGLDVAVADRRAPGRHHVLEINSSPGIAPFHTPWEGPSQDAAGALVDWLLGQGPKKEGGRIFRSGLQFH